MRYNTEDLSYVTKASRSVQRLNSIYAAQKQEEEEKLRKFKINLAWVLTGVAALGILVTIL